MKTYLYYIEGVSCSGCLRKIYALNDAHNGIQIQMNMSQNLLTLEAPNLLERDKVVLAIEQKGFHLHAVDHQKMALDKKLKENQRDLIRIATAAICAGNIMLFSVSIYSGAEGQVAKTFEWISFFLYLPILFFSARPFYENTLKAYQQKKLSIDIPLAFAVIVGGALSLYNMLGQTGETYFDSLSVLVFLILSSRFLLKKIQQKYLGVSYLSHFLPDQVKVRSKGTSQWVIKDVTEVLPGEIVFLKNNEVLAFDGELISQSVQFNNAVITGESKPITVTEKQSCYAGSKLTSNEALIQVKSPFKNSRLFQLLNELEKEMERPSMMTSFTDKASSLFVMGLFLIGALFSLYYFQIDPQETINRFLALIILACPCALALGVPLSQSLSLMKASKAGIIIKNADVFEKFIKIKNWVFDKTGTLTEGQFKLIRWKHSQLSLKDFEIIFQLEKNSQHPVANAFKQFVWNENENFKVSSENQLRNIKEIPGQGVSGLLDNDIYELKAYSGNQSIYTAVGFYKNNQLLNVAYLGDELNGEALPLVKALHNKNFQVYLLSGDSASAVQGVAEKLKIPFKNAFSEFTPEKKSQWIKNHPQSLMVGDGVNDALALSQSELSIASSGSMEATLKASDIFMSTHQLTNIYDLFLLSKATLNLVYRNLGFSLVYNLVGASLALMGYVSPLIAAILMPISSLIIIASSLWGNSYLRAFSKKYKKNQKPLFSRSFLNTPQTLKKQEVF